MKLGIIAFLVGSVALSSATYAQTKFNVPVKTTTATKQQMVINDAMSRGANYNTAKSLAVNGSSATSIANPKPLVATPAKSLPQQQVIVANPPKTSTQLYYNQSQARNPTPQCKMVVKNGKGSCVY